MVRLPPISTIFPPTPLYRSANITYTLSYSNTGNQNATGVVIADTIPANTSFVSATGGGTLAAGVVTWNIGALGRGGGRCGEEVVVAGVPVCVEKRKRRDT